MSAYKKYMLARNAVMMTGGMFKTIFLILFMVQVVSIIAYSTYIASKQTDCTGSLISTSLKYWWFKAKKYDPSNPITVTLSVCDQSADISLPYFKWYYQQELWPYIDFRLQKIFRFIKWSFLIWLGLPAAVLWFGRKGQQLQDKIHIRGPQLIKPKELYKIITKQFGKKTDLPLARSGNRYWQYELRLPRRFENRMIAAIGTSGAGKSTNTIMPMLERIIERQKKEKSCVIVYAYKEYMAEFFDPTSGHLLLNPLDARSVSNPSSCWSIFNDIGSKLDIEATAASIIPMSHDERSKFWDTAARQVLAAGLYAAEHHGMKTNRELWELFTSPTDELYQMMDGIPDARLGARHLHDPKSSRLANDVMAVLASYIMCFQYMAAADGEFSIRRFIDDGGVLFINGSEDVQDTLKPFMSALIDALARTVLSLPGDTNRRIYFVLDEFQTLNPLPSVIKLLNARSAGFSAILGYHHQGQIRRLYGEAGAEEILNFINTKIIYRVNEVKSAEYFSKLIGEREIQRLNESLGGGVNNFSDRFTLTQQIEKETLILPSELTHMPDYHCVIQLPGFDPCKIEHRHFKEYLRKNVHFVLRQDLTLDKIKEETVRQKAEKAEIIDKYEIPKLKEKQQEDPVMDPEEEMEL
ncbi:MAG: type IV secretion system DNA-binding domain-containing protein [Nitrospirota bacterium]